MSNYRDDLTDVAAASSGNQSLIRQRYNNRLVIFDNLYTKTKDQLTDNLIINNNANDGCKTWLVDTAVAFDMLKNKLTCRQALSNEASIADSLYRKYHERLADTLIAHDSQSRRVIARLLIADNITASEQASSRIKDSLSDHIKAHGQSSSTQSKGDILQEYLSIQDKLVSKYQQMTVDKLTASSWHKDKLTGKIAVSTITIAEDKLFDVIKKITRLQDDIKASDTTIGKLMTKGEFSDLAIVEDKALQNDGHQGMAWTANTVNYAMSQYNPFAFCRLAVINGVLYGESADGVYRLDGYDELIQGVMVTDKIDFGANLVKPSYAYTEYQTDGNISLSVISTQRGIKQSYCYQLPKERADELTNGRFVFGRGLYGRHFAFELHISAKQAGVNDLTVLYEQTARRL